MPTPREYPQNQGIEPKRYPSGSNGNEGASSSRERKDKQKEVIPMDRKKEEVKEVFRKNDKIILTTETGAGKTTRGPWFLYETLREEYGKDVRVAVTVPRRNIAVSIAEYVRDHNNCAKSEVGHQIRNDKQINKNTKLNFMTDGIMMRMLENDPLLEEFNAVMVDEAHERSINIDIVMGLLKEAQKKRKERGLLPLKIVISSATIEEEKFAEYLETKAVMKIEGRNFTVEKQYTDYPVTEYTTMAANKCEEILMGNDKEGDILVFMTGREDIEQTITALKEKEITKNVEIFDLHSGISKEEQKKIIQGDEKKRRIIVSTNIAEAGVTVPGIKHVVDSGLIKQTDYDPESDTQSLKVVKHSQAGLDQRAGRAGRVEDGTYYGLYPEKDRDDRDKYTKPEIKRSQLEKTVLTMKNAGIQDIGSFAFIDKPEENSLESAIKMLQRLGALDENEEITDDGKRMANMPLSPRESKIILESANHDCLEEAVTIAAFLNEGGNVFKNPRRLKQDEEKAIEAHKRFNHKSSDLMTFLKVWEEYNKQGYWKRDTWARENFLHVPAMIAIKEGRDEIYKNLQEDRSAGSPGRKIIEKEEKNTKGRKARARLNEINRKLRNESDKEKRGILIKEGREELKNIRKIEKEIESKNPQRSKEKIEEVIAKSVASALPFNIMVKGDYVRRRRDYTYRRANGDPSPSNAFFIFPGSSLSNKKPEEKPEVCLAGTTRETNQTWIENIQEIKAEWIPEIAPHLVEKGEERIQYDPEKDGVYKCVKQRIKDTWDLGEILHLELPDLQEPIDSDQATRAFAEYLAETEDSKQIIEEYNNLYIRLGESLPKKEKESEEIKGMLERDHLIEIYEKKLQDAGNISTMRDMRDAEEEYKEELRKEELRLEGFVSKERQEEIEEESLFSVTLEDFVSKDMQEEIEEGSPETVEINGVTYDVEYTIRPKSPWNEEELRAIIVMKEEDVLKLDEMPILPSARDIYIKILVAGEQPSIELNPLKEAARNSIIEGQWVNWRYDNEDARTKDLRNVDPIETDISIPEPKEYGKDPITGESLIAHAALIQEYGYKIAYFSTKEEAEQKTKETNEEIEKMREKKREQSEILTERDALREMVGEANELMVAEKESMTTDTYHELNNAVSETETLVSRSRYELPKKEEIQKSKEQLRKALIQVNREKEERGKMEKGWLKAKEELVEKAGIGLNGATLKDIQTQKISVPESVRSRIKFRKDEDPSEKDRYTNVWDRETTTYSYDSSLREYREYKTAVASEIIGTDKYSKEKKDYLIAEIRVDERGEVAYNEIANRYDWEQDVLPDSVRAVSRNAVEKNPGNMDFGNMDYESMSIGSLRKVINEMEESHSAASGNNEKSLRKALIEAYDAACDHSEADEITTAIYGARRNSLI